MQYFTMLIIDGMQQLNCQSVILSVWVNFIQSPVAISLHSLSVLDNLVARLVFIEMANTFIQMALNWRLSVKTEGRNNNASGRWIILGS